MDVLELIGIMYLIAFAIALGVAALIKLLFFLFTNHHSVRWLDNQTYQSLHKVRLQQERRKRIMKKDSKKFENENHIELIDYYYGNN